MATFISHSPAETESLGESFGRAAKHGLVIALSGELGAGKTQLVKGLARGLGITARVHSPTFTLVNEYAGGRLRLFHSGFIPAGIARADSGRRAGGIFAAGRRGGGGMGGEILENSNLRFNDLTQFEESANRNCQRDGTEDYL